MYPSIATQSKMRAHFDVGDMFPVVGENEQKGVKAVR